MLRAGSELIGRLILFAPSGLMEFRSRIGARGVGFAPGYCISRFQRGAECARHHGLATAPKNACKTASGSVPSHASAVTGLSLDCGLPFFLNIKAETRVMIKPIGKGSVKTRAALIRGFFKYFICSI